MNHEPTIDVLRELAIAGVGQSHAERIILLVLADSDQPLNPSYLADAVAMSRAAMTSILDRLAEAQLVTRDFDTSDRRRTLIAATQLGRDAIERAESSSE